MSSTTAVGARDDEDSGPGRPGEAPAGAGASGDGPGGLDGAGDIDSPAVLLAFDAGRLANRLEFELKCLRFSYSDDHRAPAREALGELIRRARLLLPTRAERDEFGAFAAGACDGLLEAPRGDWGYATHPLDQMRDEYADPGAYLPPGERLDASDLADERLRIVRSFVRDIESATRAIFARLAGALDEGLASAMDLGRHLDDLLRPGRMARDVVRAAPPAGDDAGECWIEPVGPGYRAPSARRLRGIEDRLREAGLPPRLVADAGPAGPSTREVAAFVARLDVAIRAALVARDSGRARPAEAAPSVPTLDEPPSIERPGLAVPPDGPPARGGRDADEPGPPRDRGGADGGGRAVAEGGTGGYLGLSLQEDGRVARAGHGEITLTPRGKLVALLGRLARRRGELVDREELARVWDSPADYSAQALNTAISSLRRAIAPLGLDVPSHTRGGYRLVDSTGRGEAGGE